MKRARAVVYCVAAAIAIVLAVQIASAHDPDFLLGGIGTATIDGVHSPGEWTTAGSTTFEVAVPVDDGGGTTSVTMLVMNDAVNLYVGFTVARTGFGGTTNPTLILDNAHDGALSQGDDGIGMSIGGLSPVQFTDFFTDLSTSGEIHFPRDTDAAGTNDGAAAATNDGLTTYIEMSHPLDSLDDAHDFSLAGGDIVGFVGIMNLFALRTACNDPSVDPACQALTVFAGADPNPTQNPRGDILILPLTPGACHTAAAEARRMFVDACIAEGASPATCNRTGTELMLARIRSCSAP